LALFTWIKCAYARKSIGQKYVRGRRASLNSALTLCHTVICRPAIERRRRDHPDLTSKISTFIQHSNDPRSERFLSIAKFFRIPLLAIESEIKYVENERRPSYSFLWRNEDSFFHDESNQK
jgi:hypothetical protein